MYTCLLCSITAHRPRRKRAYSGTPYIQHMHTKQAHTLQRGSSAPPEYFMIQIPMGNSVPQLIESQHCAGPEGGAEMLCTCQQPMVPKTFDHFGPSVYRLLQAPSMILQATRFPSVLQYSNIRICFNHPNLCDSQLPSRPLWPTSPEGLDGCSLARLTAAALRMLTTLGLWIWSFEWANANALLPSPMQLGTSQLCKTPRSIAIYIQGRKSPGIASLAKPKSGCNICNHKTKYIRTKVPLDLLQ